MLADLGLTAHHFHPVLDSLRYQIQRIEGREHVPGKITSSGCTALDALLPQRGLRRGTLVEWLGHLPGGGHMLLAGLAARAAAREGEWIVVSDRLRQFYVPAAVAMGLAPERLIVLQPSNAADEIWAIDQALRSTGVAAVWARLDRLPERDFRRLQLAAEQGGTLGLLLRPATARTQPSWSEMQFMVEPVPRQKRQSTRAIQPGEGNRRLRVEVVRLRGGAAGGSVTIEIDDITGAAREIPHETHPVFTISGVASAAARRQQA